MLLRTVLTVAVLLVLPAGCTNDEPAGPASPSPAASPAESGSPRELVEGTAIELVLRDGRLEAYAGCNHLSAPARVTDHAQLIVDELATTDMACRADRMAQDHWLADLLESRPTVTRAGTGLVLRADGIDMLIRT